MIDPNKFKSPEWIQRVAQLKTVLGERTIYGAIRQNFDPTKKRD